jgi:superfamily II DNA/RNA helicase
MPNDEEKYLHRIGRSGRYGRKGVAINLCDRGEMESIHRIEQFFQTRVEELPNDFAKIVKEANDALDQPSDEPGA